MIITNSKKNNLNDIRKLWDTCFDEDSTCWRNWYFENIYDIENLICAKQDNKLVSMVHMNPYSILLHHSKIDAFALSGVATEPEYRGQGLAGSLIKYALNKAYKLGYDFSFLYPFQYEYYQKFGYNLSYNKHKYKTVCIEKEVVSKLVLCDMFSLDEFAKIYARFVEHKNGFVLRNVQYFGVHMKELQCDNNIFCFIIGDKKGYFAINSVENTIEELAFEGKLETALKEITNYYKKSLTFENLYEIDSMISTKEKHCMARVVSVQRLLEKIKINDADILVNITDDIIEENNGVWHISSSGGKTSVKRSDKRAQYSIDISLLAPIVTGISIYGNEDAASIQNMLFKSLQPFIYEVC